MLLGFQYKASKIIIQWLFNIFNVKYSSHIEMLCLQLKNIISYNVNSTIDGDHLNVIQFINKM